MMSLRYVKDIQEEMSRSDEYGARTQRRVWPEMGLELRGECGPH